MLKTILWLFRWNQRYAAKL